MSVTVTSIGALVRARPSELVGNVLADASAAAGVGLTMAVVTSMLPVVARQQGLGPLGLAALAAIPFGAALLGLAAGRIGPRSPRGLALLRGFGAASLILVYVLPHPATVAFATIAFWGAFGLGVPFQQRLWGMIYPPSSRGWLIGIVGSVRFAAGTIALLAAMALAQRGESSLAFALVAVLGALAVATTDRIRVDVKGPIGRFSVVDSLATVVRQPVLRRLTSAHLVFGAGLVATPPLMAMVFVDRLRLDLADVAIVGLVSHATLAVTIVAWGRLVGRLGGMRTAAVASGLGVAGLGLIAVASGLDQVIVGSALIAAAGAAIEAALPVVIAENTDDDAQSAAAAGIAAIMGTRGLVVPFAMMVPISLGWFDVAMGLAIAAAVTLTGAVLYLWAADLLDLPMRAGVRARTLVATALGL